MVNFSNYAAWLDYLVSGKNRETNMNQVRIEKGRARGVPPWTKLFY